MKTSDQNGFGSSQVLEEVPQQLSTSTPPPSLNGKEPFIPAKEKPRSVLKENGRLVFIGAGIVLVLLLLAFNGISRHSIPAQKNSSTAKQQQPTKPDNSVPATSMTPILDTGRSPAQETDGSLVNPDQIGRTALKQQKPSAATLADVKPFDGNQWQPAPYQPGTQSATTSSDVPPSSDATQTRSEHDALDKTSLVFVRNSASPPGNQKPPDVTPAIDWGIGLPPGTRLRARLESAVNTAVRTPVVAVIEYNYEQNGEIIIPAGAKAFGHLESADHSGYIGIRFESLLMPDGSSVSLEAAATDLQLRPLRGKVGGKHTGKNVLVRSFAGVGEIAATLVGRGSLNQSLSEGDLLRERVANNIGQASDQTVANLALTERIVVSVPADTEIYVILQKAAKENSQTSRVQLPSQAATQPSIEELRQLMQLQQELNQGMTKPPE
ncbi:MAG: TrbI/VirB10 family protein [Acidobacteriia bacterium]|nr:TrbI/VirB10 family protein [Terriglobia bacterium]